MTPVYHILLLIAPWTPFLGVRAWLRWHGVTGAQVRQPRTPALLEDVVE